MQSMTGYGKATAELSDKKINIEIKSLNSKAMDLFARNGPAYRNGNERTNPKCWNGARSI